MDIIYTRVKVDAPRYCDQKSEITTCVNVNHNFLYGCEF